MRGKTRTVAVAGISALALLTAACGGSDNGGSTASGTTGSTGGDVVVNGCNPQNPLIAGNSAESCGIDVLSTITARLIHYNSDTAQPEMDIADSIDTTDNQNFTVKIKKGYKFSDGTEVKAKNFVDAWNYTAYGPNGQGNSYFFEPIEGYADVQCPDAECKQKPKAETMSGLKVVDDYTFTIKTSEKVSNLPVRLGYYAFAPQPDSFFVDPKGFGKNPVGAGPYKFDHWTENQEIVVTKNADYSGKFAGKADKITFKIFQNLDAAYAELLGGGIDVIDSIPSADMIDDKYKQDLPDRNAQRATSSFTYIGFTPEADPSIANPDVRKAISMAIDRKTIIDQIFNGVYTPATGWVSPVVDGYKADQCGDACVYDPAKAKDMLAKAGGFKGDKLTLSYNADGGHKEWIEATCNSIKNALGINCVATPVVDFKTYLTQLTDHKIKGGWRLGWLMDYPSIENYLAPIYGKSAGSNYFGYTSAKFNDLLTQAAAATTADESNKLYQEAEAQLAADFPSIPMWYGKATIGWSDKIASVKITPFGNPDYTQISVK